MPIQTIQTAIAAALSLTLGLAAGRYLLVPAVIGRLTVAVQTLTEEKNAAVQAFNDGAAKVERLTLIADEVKAHFGIK